MPLPLLSKPYLLNAWNINLVIPARTAGVYAIMRPPELTELTSIYVGRADADLAARLRDQTLHYTGAHYFTYIGRAHV